MRLNLFWQLGLAFLALLLAVLLAVGLSVERMLARDYLREGYEKLEALGRVAQARPPQFPVAPAAQVIETQSQTAALRDWVTTLAKSGARVTVITAQGVVLADSDHDPETMENHANRPEIRQAFSTGQGRAVRHSATLNRELVYLALRHQPPSGAPVILRLALPLKQIDQAVADFERRLLAASLVILVAAGGVSLLVSRRFSARVERLKAFSRRVADGDFHPLQVEPGHDALEDLARSLNETAARLDQTITTLTDERNRSAAILRSMTEGVAVISADERVLFSNQAFSEILGLDVANCEGRRLLEVTRQSDLLVVIQKALSAGESGRGEVVVGTVRPRSFLVTAAPVLGPRSGEVTGAVVVLHDISEQRRLERVRRDFVANVSHEFKTPLTAIQGFAETLLAGAIDDQQNRMRFVEIIRDHAQRLARLTDDLLKLSQIEAGKMELEFLPVSVGELIAACVQTARFKAERKQHTLEIDCPPGLPPARGDFARLREVLQNLLDNAVQYTPEGGRIIVRARIAEGAMEISVSDTGIGIPQADHERIFERFYRVDAARSREVGGTGLGLSIARHIVEAHGGRIWVESAVGEGSHFHFTIPLTVSTRQSSAAP